MGADHHRIARDPRNSALYYSKFNGEIYRITLQPGNGTSTSTKLYGGVDHGISDRAQGISPWAKAGVMFRQSTVVGCNSGLALVLPYLLDEHSHQRKGNQSGFCSPSPRQKYCTRQSSSKVRT